MLTIDTFKGFTDRSPMPDNLERMAMLIRSDSSLQVSTRDYRLALAAGHDAKAREVKGSVLCFAVAVRFNGGKADTDIVSYTGLTLVDLDKIAPSQLPDVLATVKADPHTLLAYTTLSGCGVRVVARYEGSLPSPQKGGSPESAMTTLPPPSRGGQEGAASYKLAFNTVNEYYRRLTGIVPDKKCSNPTRLSALAYDPEVLFRPEAEAMDIDALAAQYAAEHKAGKRPVGRPRKAAKVAKVVRAADVADSVRRMVEAQGVRYEPHSHNDYICRMCYEMNRRGVTEVDCCEWAVEEFAEYAATDDVPAIVRSCYRKTDEHATRTARRSNRATVADIQRFLTDNNVCIRYNVVTRKREILIDADAEGASVATTEALASQRSAACSPFLSGGQSLSTLTLTLNWKELESKHVNSLYCRLCLTTGLTSHPNDLYNVIESDFYPEYHPLRDYLGGLPEWDGHDYIDELASMVHVEGCTQAMHNRYFKMWMVAMVAAWCDDRAVNHEILAYIGAQGKYKTTFMTHLLPPVLADYFAMKNFRGKADKDDRLALTELALVDLDDMDSLKPTEVEQLKALVTDPAVNLRPVYERYAVRRKHIASFCATGNNPRFLTDLSGNRRWLPFRIAGIDSPFTHDYPYEGIYAQAYHLWQTGFRYWLDEADDAELALHHRQFEELTIEEELIYTYLRVPGENETGEFLTTTRIIELIGHSIRTPLDKRKVGRAMARMGFAGKKTMKANGWNVIVLTGDDIKNRQRLDALNSSNDDSQ